MRVQGGVSRGGVESRHATVQVKIVPSLGCGGGPNPHKPAGVASGPREEVLVWVTGCDGWFVGAPGGSSAG